MANLYADLHVHTNRSDGGCSIEEVVRLADAAQNRVIMIADHDKLPPVNLKDYEKYAQGRVRLIRGVEINTFWECLDPSVSEAPHILAAFCKEHTPAIDAVLERNRKVDISVKARKVLTKLDECGKGIGTYEELCARYPDKDIGKAVFAEEMVRQGHVPEVDVAYKEYLAGHGKRKAYVSIALPYVPMEEAVEAIYADEALPIFPHPNYYVNLTKDERMRLYLAYLKCTRGRPAGMEVNVARDTPEQCAESAEICTKLGFYPTSGSDFHGNSIHDTLNRKYPYEWYEDFEMAYCAFFGHPPL